MPHSGNRMRFLPMLVFMVLLLSGCAMMQVAMDKDAVNDMNKLTQLTDNERYGDALAVALKLSRDSERKFGKTHEFTIMTKYIYAAMLLEYGDTITAERIFEDMLRMQMQLHGPSSTEAADAMHGLALAYSRNARFAEAIALANKSIDILVRKYGEDDLKVARARNDAAIVFNQAGDQGTALTLYRKALNSESAKAGKDPKILRSMAGTMANLAGIYGDIGDYDQARQLIDQANGLYEQHAPNSLAQGSALTLAGDIYGKLGNTKKAEALFSQGLAIAEAKLGKDSPGIVNTLNISGVFYVSRDVGKAEPLLQRALKIRERTMAKSDPKLAVSYNNIGELYSRKFDYPKAELSYKRALSIWEHSLGERHIYTAIAMHNIGDTCARQGRIEEARAWMLRSQAIMDEVIDQVMGFTSESQKLSFLTAQQELLTGLISVAALNPSKKQATTKDAFGIWLRRKGLVLEILKGYQNALFLSGDPKVAKIFTDLSAVRTQLSGMAFAGPGPSDAAAFKSTVAALEARKQALEAELARVSQTYANDQKMQKVTPEHVARSLPPGSVLVDIARLKLTNFRSKSSKDPKWLPEHYLVFVMHAGKPDSVRLLDLGKAAPIDQAITKLRGALAATQSAPTQPESAQAVLKASVEVNKLVFQPLRPALGNSKDIFISPDGLLNLVPFEILASHSGRFLIQDYTFNYLGTGRDVAVFGRSTLGSGPSIIIGNPAYDMETKATAPPQAVSRTAITRGLSTHRFGALPGTQAEVEAIRSVLGVAQSEYYTGAKATETALTSHPSPRILHLATHGFYFNDQDFAAFFNDGDLLSPGRPAPSPAAVLQEDPLLRSGFVLAGANVALKTGKTGPGDGLITSQKILGLNLQGSELVVLSACQSGLGEVRSGEGVFGLRRAFSQAGAKSMIMSMWSVPDGETKDLMSALYKNMQAKGMNRAQALRQAALQEIEITRAHYGHANPWFWGAFVFVGER